MSVLAPSTQGGLVDSGGVVCERNVVVDLGYADGFTFGLVGVFARHGFSRWSDLGVRLVR